MRPMLPGRVEMPTTTTVAGWKRDSRFLTLMHRGYGVLRAVPLREVKAAGGTPSQNRLTQVYASICKACGPNMETFQPALALHFSERLAYRERELRAMLQEVESIAAHVSDVSEGEVVDFKDMAVEETQAVVEQAQAGHAVEELGEEVAARRRLEDG